MFSYFQSVTTQTYIQIKILGYWSTSPGPPAETLVDTPPLAAKNVHFRFHIWTSDSLPTFLFPNIVNSCGNEGILSAALNVEPLAFTQTSSYCSSSIASISGENKRGAILEFEEI